MRIDLRSDTAVQPTRAMLERINSLYFGDDLLGEDQATNALVAECARMLGTEHAMLTPSGSMSNQIAVATLTRPGDEVVLGAASHIYNLEVAGLAANTGVQARCVPVHQGVYDTDALEAAIRTAQLQVAATGLISLESTYDLNSGYVTPLENLREIRRIADRYGLPVYLDGARIFNAAEALGVELPDICQYVDAVQLCLNKGLGAPLGSVLAGSRRFVDSARRIRQRLGGGMRHTGLLAAPALVALPDWRTRIGADRIKAGRIADKLQGVPHLTINNAPLHSNIVNLTVDVKPFDQFIERLSERGVFVKKVGPDRVRLVAHSSVTENDIDHACEMIGAVVSACR